MCDDNSPDGTGKIAEEVGEELGGVEVLHRPTKEGLGAAYRHGFRHALDTGATIIVQMDVDFSHDPVQAADLIADVEKGIADVAVGSRYIPGGGTPDWSLHRKLLSSYGNLYARFMLHLGMRDSTSGFRAYTSEVLERIHFDTTRANGYGFQIETSYRLMVAGARIVEHPLVFRDCARHVEDVGPDHGGEHAVGDLVGALHAPATPDRPVPSHPDGPQAGGADHAVVVTGRIPR